MSRRPPRLRRRSISVSSTDSYGSSGEASMLFTPLNDFFVFCWQVFDAVWKFSIWYFAFVWVYLNSLYVSLFALLRAWSCVLASPLRFVSNFNLIPVILLDLQGKYFLTTSRPLPLAPISIHDLFFEITFLGSCHLCVRYLPCFTASYSDSYSSDEDDVSPRERSQVCIQHFFFSRHNLFSLILLLFGCSYIAFNFHC